MAIDVKTLSDLLKEHYSDEKLSGLIYNQNPFIKISEEDRLKCRKKEAFKAEMEKILNEKTNR